MRKLSLLVAALAVTVGAAAAMACDNDKASSTTASASKSSSGCCSSSNANTSVASTASGECPYAKSASAGSCSAHKNASAMAKECKDADCADAVFSIASIHGDCCVDGVETALKSVKNVQYVNVDVKTKKAYVCTRGAKLDQKAAIKSLKDAGFANAVYVGTAKNHMMKEATKTSAKTNAAKV